MLIRMDLLRQVVFKPKKIFWREKGTEPYAFICPLCNSPRKVPLQPRPTPRHYAQIALTAAMLMLATWPFFGLKGVVWFIPLWTGFEILYRSRLRGALRCEKCGFDPVLYLSDVSGARREVETHWRGKFAEKGIPYPEKPEPAEPRKPPPSGKLLATNVIQKNPRGRPRN